MKNVYISCPISISQSTLDEIRDRAAYKNQMYAHYWERDSYYQNGIVQNADRVIIVHPKGAFKFNIKSLPTGVQKEFATALNYGKDTYLAYKSTSINPGWNFYKVTFDAHTGEISGIPGSTNVYFNDLPIEKLDESKEVWTKEDHTKNHISMNMSPFPIEELKARKSEIEFNKKTLLLVRARRLKS